MKENFHRETTTSARSFKMRTLLQMPLSGNYSYGKDACSAGVYESSIASALL